MPDLTRKTGPIYFQLLDSLKDDVASGRLLEGDRLPTHRELAKSLNINPGTVAKAYSLAQQQGLLSAGIGRGSFVAPGSAKAAATVDPASDGTRIVDLANVAVSREADGAALQRLMTQTGFLKERIYDDAYASHVGIEAHRRSVAAWLRDTADISVPPSQVLLTGGGQHGFLVALAALPRERRIVLCERYCYPGFQAAAQMLGVELHVIDGDEEGARPDTLQSAARDTGARLVYLMPTLHCAVPIVSGEKRRRDLADAARKAGLIILEDGVFDPLLGPGRPSALRTLAPERTIYLTSFEKTVSTDLAVGVMAAPDHLVPSLAAGIRASTWSASPLLTGLAAAAVDSRLMHELLQRNRTEATGRQRLISDILSTVGSVQAHEAAFHLWVTVPASQAAQNLHLTARNAGIDLAPASAFAVVPREEDERSARIALMRTRDEKELRSAVERLAILFASSLRPDLSIA